MAARGGRQNPPCTPTVGRACWTEGLCDVATSGVPHSLQNVMRVSGAAVPHSPQNLGPGRTTSLGGGAGWPCRLRRWLLPIDCSESHWRHAEYSASQHRVDLEDLLHSRDYAWEDIALLRWSMASAAESKPAERLVRHVNTAVIDAVRRGAKEVFRVHPDSREATMIEDATKLLVLLSLQVELQDEGNCHAPYPFVDNAMGDAVPAPDKKLPE